MKALARCAGLVIAAALAPAPVGATELALGEDLALKLSATVTFGTGIRMQEPLPANFGPLAGARVGRTGGLTSANSGGPNLNFEDGEPYSTVLKGFVDFALQGPRFGAFARLRAWHDFELEEGDRPYGNFPNAFATGAPLSDRGFAREARFSEALFTEAYVRGRLELGAARSLEARLGRQVVSWGAARSLGGGINVVNPIDLAAEQRPGALPEETRIPVGMVYAELHAGPGWSVEALMPYEWRATALQGCGTYFNVATYAPEGCLQANVLPTVNEAAAFANNLYVHRAPDVAASDSGEFGLSLRYRPSEANDFRAYAMNYHSRAFHVRGINANVAGGFGTLAPPFFSRLTSPDGVKYALVYPEDIRLFGLSFDARRGRATRFFGEIAFRENQPVSLNLADVVDAFVARNPRALLAQPASGVNALALPPGATFDAYDRFDVTTLILGAGQGLPGILGADRIVVGLEAGWSHVHNLPDPNVRRYGRSDAYGVAAVPGFPCVDSYPGKTCTLEGFVTSNAWGYRARLSAAYESAFLGATLIPSLGLAHDVDGYSHDGTFLEGRTAWRPSLRAEWGKTWFAEVAYTYVRDATRFSMLVDRDHMVLFAGARL